MPSSPLSVKGVMRGIAPKRRFLAVPMGKTMELPTMAFPRKPSARSSSCTDEGGDARPLRSAVTRATSPLTRYAPFEFCGGSATVSGKVRVGGAMAKRGLKYESLTWFHSPSENSAQGPVSDAHRALPESVPEAGLSSGPVVLVRK